jgi:hypothetical protein
VQYITCTRESGHHSWRYRVCRYLKETYPPGRIFRWYRRYTTYAVGPFFSTAERLFRLELVSSTLPQPIATRRSPRVVEGVRGCQAQSNKAE